MIAGSTTKRAILAAAIVFFSSGCSKSSKEEKAEPAPKTAAAPAPSDSAGVKTEKEPAQAPEGPTGSIKGVVTISGETPEMPLLRRGSDPVCDTGEMRAETILVGEGGTLANVVVRIKPGSVPAWTPSKSVLVDQKNCMYRPRVQGGVRGQKVEISNADATTHNVHARHLPLGRRQGTETIMNRAQPAGMAMSFELGDEPVAKLKCDYHGWMQGYVVVSDNPYFGASKSDGSYEITGVPTGTHTIEMWHEYYGIKTTEVTVEENGTATLDYSYDASADDPMRATGEAGVPVKKASK
jgi:plastocyanin